MKSPETTFIYHFTNINNLGSIVKRGLIADSFLSEDNYINSGNPKIKGRRKAKIVPFGGVVADYVPFYFASRSPMLYTQWINGRVRNEEIIYLVSTTTRIIEKKYKWCCSNINAAKHLACFYDKEEELLGKISWDVMKEKDWRNDEDHPDRRERRMAEFLVHHTVRWEDIFHIGVYDEDAQRTVKAIVGPDWSGQVTVCPTHYFR